MPQVAAALLTLLAGGVVALQPPANAALATRVGNLGAAFLSATITFSILTGLLLLAGHPGRISELGRLRPSHALGGIAGATVVAVSLVAVRRLGAGGVTALLVSAQLIVSVVADRLGWFGLHRAGLTPGRLAGVGLVIAGTVLVTRS